MCSPKTNSSTAPRAAVGRGRAVLAVVLLLAVAAALTAAPLALADPETRSVSESRPASPDGRVSVETVSGTLEVRGWSEDRVEVTGTLDSRLSLAVEATGGQVTVKVEWPKRASHLFDRDTRCDLRVRIPQRGSLDVEVVSAETEISDIEGIIDVESVSGGVTIGGTPKRVVAQVVSGRLDISAGDGGVKAEAVSGQVAIRASGGDVEGGTVSGRVTVEGGPFERVSLEAVSGDIEFEGSLTSDAAVDISNHSGAIDFALAGTQAGEFDVSTFSGSIESEFGGASRRTSKWAPGEEYHRTVGDGGPRVRIEAFSGTVRLRPKGVLPLER